MEAWRGQHSCGYPVLAMSSRPTPSIERNETDGFAICLIPLMSNVRTLQIMKTTVVAFSACFMATSALAVSTPSLAQHPLYGKWEWTYAKNNCTEVYNYRQDNTSVVTSGEERGESRFTISDKPDLNGFYRMTDVVTKSNGRTGCDGEPGGTPVGDSATIYILFSPTKTELVICQEPSLNACMGPLRRISQ